MRYGGILVGAAGLAMLGCRTPTTPDMTMPTPSETVPLDEELMAEVTASYQQYEDISLAVFDMTTDEAGCPIPKWQNTHGYFYNTLVDDPDYGLGMGVHVQDPTYPQDEFVESRARMLMYDYREDGSYELAGLEWYYEPAGGVVPDELPTVFGAPMVGLMQPHTPAQGIHYDLHAWFYKTSEENDFGYFNEFNKGMSVQPWYLELENALYGSLLYYDPSVYSAFGYVPAGPCIEGTTGDVGFPLVNESLVGAMDSIVPDTLLVTVDNVLMAIQWTKPDDGSGVPEMFGIPMTLDGNGNYVLRVWQSFRTNPVSFFAPENPAFDCAEPALPPGCGFSE